MLFPCIIERSQKLKQDQQIRMEIKEYRNFTGKLNRLGAKTRPDMSYTVLKLLQKTDSATIVNLHDRNKIMKKVRVQESEVFIEKLDIEMNYK